MKVFVKGYNNEGQLNRATNGALPVEMLKEIKLNFKIKKIACGYYHILILTENNELYGCGSNTDGQLGIIDDINIFEFKKIDNLKFNNNIKLIECGGYFSTLLTKNNELYLTGQGACGQLGFGNSNSLYEFTKSNFNFGKIKSMKCCGGTTIVMNDRGIFYMCGSNFGLVDLTYFGKNVTTFQQFYENSNIIDFKCGYEHIVMLDKFGQLFYFEKDAKNVSHWPTPFKIKQIGCGYSCFTILNEKNELFYYNNDFDEYQDIIPKEEKKLEKIELNNVKQLFYGLCENTYVTTFSKVYEISIDKKVTFLCPNEAFEDNFIYPITGYNFIYVITSNIPLLSLFEREESKEMERMLMLLLKQLNEVNCLKDIQFIFD